MSRDIESLIEEIEARKNRGSGLPHFKQYMDSIGNPHQDLAVIHVGGTNGKGSTVNYIRSILQCAGYRVGTFTSPYLETHRDRIRINDEFISEQDFLDIADQYYASWIKYDLSMFEIDMAIASVYFQKKQCDICIFEVGLGGRWDLTNIVHPLVCVITNIGMDHMEQLGDRYEKIAFEKAGIIKEHVPVVSAETKEECLQVFQEQCAKKHADLIPIQTVQPLYERDQITFSYREYDNIVIKNAARYQIKNASCAIEAIIQLCKRSRFQVTKEAMVQGIKTTQWKGRFETVWQHPTIILDGAHNKEGIQALAETLQEFPKVRILFAALKDKDSDAMVKQLLKISEDITITQFPFYRAQRASVLGDGYPVTIEEDFQQAIQQAMLDHKTPLVITGSLYFISQVREYLLNLT